MSKASELLKKIGYDKLSHNEEWIADRVYSLAKAEFEIKSIKIDEDVVNDLVNTSCSYVGIDIGSGLEHIKRAR